MVLSDKAVVDLAVLGLQLDSILNVFSNLNNPMKLLRYDYSLQYNARLEIPELPLEELACKRGTI